MTQNNLNVLSQTNVLPTNNKLVTNYCYLSVVNKSLTTDICIKDSKIREVKVLSAKTMNLLQKTYLSPFKDSLITDLSSSLEKKIIKHLQAYDSFDYMHHLTRTLKKSKTIFDILNIVSDLINFAINKGCFDKYKSNFIKIIMHISNSYNFSLSEAEMNLVSEVSKKFDNIIKG